MNEAHSAIRARYRHDDAPLPITDNATLHTLFDHRSIRAYLPDALDPGTIETLVAAAQSAASSSNLQVWSVVAVQDPERKGRLAALAGNQKHIVEAPLLLVWLIDFDRLTQIGEALGTRPEALDYTESFLLGAVDASLAAQNAVVALESLGLGSVYIGGIRNKPVEVAAELNLPPRVFPLFGLVVGRPDPARPASIKPRLPQASVLFHEHYAWTEAQVEAARHYDERLRGFQREQGLIERDWSDQASERTRGPWSMAGRHVLRDVLGELGFQLR
ncbi:NADPH-dependent oxidoreductase [Sphingomonas alpina]|uniref:NADPH-dependent oxidoreductase n=1 Tax=Sphingomonas alpina TaxID=653931 RepID=A0A7H0LFP1_9SPHN|nr:NADPH-dependent oxidoreductase [Sphingomonas alpina]QNQ08494.1 NADPH-dependent oxidoreductase [Sphingomonas alpina]